MPRGASRDTEREAVEIVRTEESARGWSPGQILSQRAQPVEGCDFLSTPPGGGPPHPIEVKGWGEPLVKTDGSFTYPADINVEQYERARRDPNWRLEIVANLTAAREGRGSPERLTLTAAEVLERASAWKFKVGLHGLQKRIRHIPR